MFITNQQYPCSSTTGLGRFIFSLVQWSGRMVLASLIAITSVAAATIPLNAEHPDRYVVVKGDTLWDISGRFLRGPWHWPRVWKGNPQIENPNLIYPGDIITLSYRNGIPELTLERSGSQRGDTVRLSPGIRTELLDRAIPTIAPDAIQQFLTQTRPVALEEMQNAPYIVASAGEHLASAAGDKVYALGLNGKPLQSLTLAMEKKNIESVQTAQSDILPVPNLVEPGTRFGIFRLGDPYHNSAEPSERPEPEDIIGYEGIYVGEAMLESLGNPATLLITRAAREVLIGDRLLPMEERAVNQNFFPHVTDSPVEGRIVSVVDGVTRVGQYQVVALNLGNRDGVEPGHVFAVFQRGGQVRDIVSDERNDVVQLPDERAGVVMVFRSFERMSYALVMESRGPLQLYDIIRNP